MIDYTNVIKLTPSNSNDRTSEKQRKYRETKETSFPKD